MNAAGNVTEWLSIALLMVTGSLDRVGGTIYSPGVLKPREGTPLPPDIPYDDRFEELATGRRVPRIQGSLPCAALPREIEAGFVRALIVLGGNPAVVFPQTVATNSMLAALDLLIAIDIRETDTTAMATHVLPTTFQFERADVNPSHLAAEPFAQYTRAVVQPGAQRRPTWWIYNELSRRLSVPLFGIPEVDQFLGGKLDDDDMVINLLMALSRMPIDTIREAEHGLLDDNAPAPGWLIPGLLARPVDLAPASILKQFERWEDELPRNDELVLICRRLPRQVNSMMREVKTQLDRGPYPTLLVHTSDAAHRGIVSGDSVEVASPFGSVVAVAEVDDSIRAGAVSLTHAWASPNVNLLTSYDDVDPVTLMPRFTGRPVTVGRVENATNAPPVEASIR